MAIDEVGGNTTPEFGGELEQGTAVLEELIGEGEGGAVISGWEVKGISFAGVDFTSGSRVDGVQRCRRRQRRRRERRGTLIIDPS
jgi:hypothetical protein